MKDNLAAPVYSGPQLTEWSPLKRQYALAVLCIAAIFNYIDRQIITILIEPIKAEFGASDTAMGLLTGLVFAGFYALFAIPLARLSDRYSRRTVLAACLTVWSLLTSLGGLAQSFLQLAATRVGVAAAESGAVPASHAIISDLFRLRVRGTAIAVLSSAQSVGIGMGVLLGGWLSQAFSWRVSFLVVGVPGLLVAALLMLTFKEPPRGFSDGKVDTAETPPFGETITRLWKIRTYRCLVLTVGLAGLTGYGVLGWGPTFLLRVHQMSPTEVGVWFGPAVAGSLILGNMLGGVLADWLGGRDLRAYLWIAGGGPLLSITFFLLFVSAPTGQLAVGYMFVGMLLLTSHIPTCYTMGQSLVPPRMRAMASVIMGLASVLAGSGFGPLAIGAMNDLLAARFDDEAVRYSIGIISLAAAAAAATAFLGAIWIRRDYARAQS